MKTILYVDDEDDIRLVVSACLEDAGFRVLTAANAADGLTAAQSQFPDLIISDVMMPDESGYSMCTKLKADDSTKNIPVVFLSVMDDEVTGLEVGATAFLCKPFEEEELLKTVNDILQSGDGRAQLDQALACLRDKKLDEGEAMLKKVLEVEPDGPIAVWASYYVGQVHQVRGLRDAAREAFLDVLTRDPQFWRAHNRLSLLFEGVDPPRAINHLQRSLAINPNQADIRARLEGLQGTY
ncbi:MAG: response regulator [Acidobacteriota bacterium]